MGREVESLLLGHLYISQVRNYQLLEGALSPKLKEIAHGTDKFAKHISESIIFLDL